MKVENTHDFCMAFAQCTNEFGLTLMQWPITITSKSDLKSKAKMLVLNIQIHLGTCYLDVLEHTYVCNLGLNPLVIQLKTKNIKVFFKMLT